MNTESPVVRSAHSGDVPGLTAIRYDAVLHRDRIRDAAQEALRYLLLETNGVPIAFVQVVLRQPAHWPELFRLPQAMDLTVREDCRRRGAGTALLQACEAVAHQAGFSELWLGVDPTRNASARRLYEQLGYAHDGRDPVVEPWTFTDSSGVVHRGEERLIYLRRELAP